MYLRAALSLSRTLYESYAMMAALPVKGLRPPTFNEYAHVTRNYDFENAVCNGPSLGALGEPRVSRRVKNKMEQDVASIVGSDDRRHRTSACAHRIFS